jgi:hypothetical protein
LIKLLAKKLSLSLADARKFWRETEEEVRNEMAAQAAKANDGPARDAERKRYWKLCSSIAESLTLMDDFVSVSQRSGIVGEARAIKTTYLSATSRLAVADVLSTLREGAASAGKSYAIDTVLKFVPKEDIVEVTTSSPMVLVYMGEEETFLKGKILNVAEAVTLSEKKDGSEPNPFATMVRLLLSKGMINHWVTITRKNRKPIGMQIIREGPIVVMVTTARDNLDNETRTRLISTKADESHSQTVKVVKRIFATPVNPVTPAELENWLAFQRWLAIDGPYDVVIPFTDAISEAFGEVDGVLETTREYPLRARRDATALKAAISASAILHKAQRETDGNGRIIATFDDYRLAHAVIDPSAATRHLIAALIVANLETPGATLQAIGWGMRHAWLHPNRWEAWRERRRAEAIVQLAAIGIAAPKGNPDSNAIEKTKEAL